MITKDLNASKREPRRSQAGMIPAIVYGRTLKENIPVFLEANILKKIFSHREWESTIFHLNIEGDKKDVIIKEVQFDTFKHNILHIDLMAISKDQKIELNIPVKLIGTSIGVKNGGVLEHLATEIKVKCLPANIPEHIEIDISALDVGDYFKVEQLSADTGYEIMAPKGEIIVTIGIPSTLKAKEEETKTEEAAAAEAAAAGKEGVPVTGKAAPATGKGAPATGKAAPATGKAAPVAAAAKGAPAKDAAKSAKEPAKDKKK